MREIWKEIKGYEGKYRVSDAGRVKSKYGIIKPYYNKAGYPRVKFYGEGGKKDAHAYLVHRLVYNTFNDLSMDYNYKNLICHKDNNPKNPHLNNLYLGTYRDNMIQCRDEGRLKVPAFKGEKNPKAKLKNSDITNILSLIKSGVLQKDVAKMYGVSPSVICSIFKGRTRKSFTL